MATEPQALFKVPNELRTLVEKCCNEALSEQESARLNALLRQGAEARSFYLAYTAIDSRLQWQFGARLPGELPDGASAECLPAGVPSIAAHSPSRRFRRSWAIAGSVAAVVVVAICFLFANRAPKIAEVPQPVPGAVVPVAEIEAVATLSGCHEAQWAGADRSGEIGKPLAAGRLHLLAGVAEITFADGAVVLLQGPGELEVVTAARGFLHHGRAVVRIPEKAQGFVLATRSVDILDLGTEFAVSVGPSGKTEVQVFGGSVIAQVNDAPEGTIAKRLIKAGKAIAVDAGADIVVQEVPYTPEKYVRAISSPRQLANVAKPSPIERPAATAEVSAPVPAPAIAHPVAVPEGPILLLTFERDTFVEKDGQGMFLDQSGNGNHGRTLGGTPVAEGISGGAWQLDGEDDYIECAHSESFNIKGPMTISMWLKLEKWDHGGGLCTKGTGEGGESWLVDVQGDKIRFVRRPTAVNPYPSVTAKEHVTPGKWYHVVAIADGQRLRLFTNLEETIGEAYAKESQINDHAVTIGSRQAEDGPYDANVGGIIDEVAIWPRALTEDEVRALYERDAKSKGLE